MKQKIRGAIALSCLIALASCSLPQEDSARKQNRQSNDGDATPLPNQIAGGMLLIGTQYTTDNDGSRIVSSGRLLAQKSRASKSRKAKKPVVKRKNSLLPGQYPESSERLLTEKDIEHQTAWGMRVMLNEIYARKGYIFQDADLKKHFQNEKWYRGRQRSLNKIKLSPIEIQNITFIKKYQQNAKI